jgi:DinB family protein
MTHSIVKKTARLLAAGVLVTLAVSAQTLTQAERERALRYLTDTRNGVSDAVKGLSEAQWKFKPAPDRWSVAEVVEHLALTEELVSKQVLADLNKAPAGAANRDVKQVDAMIVDKITDRTTKFEAPPPVAPTGRWTPATALDHFLDGRAQTIALLQSTPDLRQHVINHPAFGPLDGYEWILAVAGHSARHTKQIIEVKADPNFPAK